MKRKLFGTTNRNIGLLLGAASLASLLVACGSADNESLQAASEDENVAEAEQAGVAVNNPMKRVADTWISNAPGLGFLNYGSATKGRIGYKTYNGTQYTYRTLAKWDLSEIPKFSTVSSAVLKFTLASGISVAPTLFELTKDWNESTVTWANFAPGWPSAPFATGPAGTTNPMFGSKYTYSIDVKALVQQWVDHTKPNYGIAIGSTSSFGEIEYTFSSPMLVVSYTSCEYEAEGKSCDDRNPCTTNDKCTGPLLATRQCVGTPVVCPGIACKANACNPATGACEANPVPNGTSCDDNNKCTSSSSCQNGSCIGVPVVCPGDVCNTPGVCQAATGTCSPSTPLNPNIDSNLIHRWTFDEPSGDAADLVGTAPGKFGSSTSRITSFNGSKAANLTPTSKYDTKSIVQLEKTEPLAANYTVSAWVKTPVPSDRAVLFYSADSSLRATLNDYNGKVMVDFPQVFSGTGAQLEVSNYFTDNTWRHIVFVRAQNSFRTYVNGAEVTSRSSPPAGTMAGLRLGGYASKTNWWGASYAGNASFEDVRIYDRALSACDVSVLAQPEQSLDTSGPLATCPPMAMGFWRGNDSLADSASTNNGASGTQNGATPVTYAGGHDGNAFALNGSSYVQVPNASNLQITGPITMSAWVYLNTAGGRIFDKLTAGQQNGFLLDTYQGKLRMVVGPNSAIVSPSLLPVGAWAHVAGTWDGISGKLYVNGSLAHSYNPPNPQAIPSNTLDLRLGADSNGQSRLDGLIDDAALFDQALTATQISALASALSPAAPSGWWKGDSSMVDASGDNDGASGTQNGGTAVTYAPGKIANAFSLNGQNFVDVPNSSSLQISGPFTLSSWIYIQTPGGRLIDKTSVGASNGYLLDTYQGKLRLIAGPSATYSTVDPLPVGAWTHVAGSWDGTTARLYVNGALAVEQTPATPQPIPINNLPLRIGADSNGASRFVGLIDEPAVYASALSQTQITALANGARADLMTECQATACGNGTLDFGEDCDNGPNNSNDMFSACTTSCTATGVIGHFSAANVNGASTPADGSPVSQWADLAFGKHAVLSAAGQEPIYRATAMNGGPALEFDGLDDALFAPIDINYTKYPKLTVVARFQNVAGGPDQFQGLWGHDNGGFDRFLITATTAAQQTGISNGSAVIGVPGITATGAPLVVTAVLQNGAGAGTSSVFINGNLVTSFAEDHGNQGSTQFAIGNINQPPGHSQGSFRGYIDRIVIYNRALSAGEVQAIQAAL